MYSVMCLGRVETASWRSETRGWEMGLRIEIGGHLIGVGKARVHHLALPVLTAFMH